MDTSEFRDVFAAEARDYLQSLNDDLLALETTPDNPKILDEMFRAAHSLKGMSGTMGFEALADFTHQMESVLDLLRTGEIVANKEIINVLFTAIDYLELLLEKTLLGEDVTAVNEIASTLEEIIVNKERFMSTSEQSSDLTSEQTDDKISGLVILDPFDRETVEQGYAQGYDAFEIRIRLRPKTLLKSVRVYTIFQALESMSTIIKCKPSAQDLEEERFDLEFSLVVLTQEKCDTLVSIIENVSEVDNVQALAIDRLSPTMDTEGTAGNVDAKTATLQPISKANANANSELQSEEPPKELPIATPVQNRGVFADKFVRVETDRLDKLINLVGELVISRTQVLEMGKSIEQAESKSTIVQLDRITTDLQYAAMKLRMVPIKQVFDRFSRMVRDLAQATNKEIQLEMKGENTELDRSLVNQIGDPLVHLLRNSIDHGIEQKDVRLAKGKTAQGHIRIEARHEGSHVLVEVSDDGQGVNVEKVRAKAVKRGLISANSTAELTMKDAISLIFEPGFSTSDQVTDVSGRGVGMDAVKASVEMLSGSVEMESSADRGSMVIIKLPLTLAIIKALLVVTHQQTYAIPISSVRENLLVSPEQIKSVNQKKVIVLRNEVLPLLDLAEILGFSRSQVSETLSVIIVESHGEKVGLIVEDLLGQQEIVIKSLSDLLGDIPGIAGATVLGNGQVALILDNSTLIQKEE